MRKPHAANFASPSKLVQKEAERFTEAVQKAVLNHHQAERPVPEERNGQIVWIGPGNKIVPSPRS